MESFYERWHSLSSLKSSNIVAGLDPVSVAMGRKVCLSKNTNILKWSINYINAVAPYVTAIKFNAGYFNSTDGMMILERATKAAQGLGLLTIIDSKIADIDSTAEAWICNWKHLGFDALTVAPYAGNIEGVIKLAKKYEIAAISMGLMSNPEYKTEMYFQDTNGVSLWKNRVMRAVAAGVDGLVVGGTYTAKDSVLREFVDLTKNTKLLYLVPGIGAQGGKIGTFLQSGIDASRCMISVGRSLMFPDKNNASPNDQALAAKTFRDSFNNALKEFM